MQTTTGDSVWAATSHEGVREVYTASDLGRTHPDPQTAARLGDHPVLEGPSELYSHADEQHEHAQMRRLLSGYFSARRIAQMQPFITEVTTELLDAVAAQSPPIDLHQALSHPLPLRVLCELLGVPFADRGTFSRMATRMGDLDSPEVAGVGHEQLQDYLLRTVRTTRALGQATGVIGGLCASGIDDEEVAGLCSLLLFAGFGSTAFHIDAGVVLLLEHPDQYRELSQRPESIDGAVEEILRLGERDAMGFLRYARTPAEFAGATLAPGEAVVPLLSLANVDHAIFDQPLRFDTSRIPNPHLTFGHGPWHCLGAPLARAVLRTVLNALAARFPQLGLAVSVESLEQDSDGFTRLPVTW